jgi:hypothetical protein
MSQVCRVDLGIDQQVGQVRHKLLMVRSAKRVSNHEAPSLACILRDARVSRAPQDEGRTGVRSRTNPPRAC